VPVIVADACGSKTADAKARSLSSMEETGEVIRVNTAELVSALRPR
jgi:hypothetical protein